MDRSAGGSRLHNDIRNLFRRPSLAAHQAEDKLVIVFDQAWGIDKIALAHRVQQVLDGSGCRDQLRRVGGDLEFRLLAALHHNRRDARHAVKPRFDFITSCLPYFGQGNGA